MKRLYIIIFSSVLVLAVTLLLATCGGGGGGGGALLPPLTWHTQQLGTAYDDFGNGIAVDGSGNVYVTGDTDGGLDGNTNAGSTDAYVVKYNSAGTKQWTRQLGTTSADWAFDVAVDGSGDVYVAGIAGGDLDGNTNAGDTDAFVVKYNSTGTKQWTRQLGTAASDGAYGIAADGSGNVYLTGYTQGGLDGNTGAGSTDVFVAKYNSAGTKQWTEQLGTTASDGAGGIAVDTNGDVYATGSTGGGLDGNTNAGGTDLFVVKYDSAGIKQWTEQLGTTAADVARGIAVDTSGNVYVTGDTSGDLDGNTNAGNLDLFVVKYNSTGTKQWTRQLGTTADEYAYGVAVDTSGDVYVTGTTGGGLDGNTNAGSYDLFVVKYDTAGTKQWTRQLGTTDLDVAYGIAVDRSGNACVVGDTYGGLDGNTNAGSRDVFVVKYSPAGVKQ